MCSPSPVYALLAALLPALYGCASDPSHYEPPWDYPAATAEDITNLQKLVGAWNSDHQTRYVHSEFKLRGDEIVVEAVWDEDEPAMQIMKGEVRDSHLRFRLRARKIYGRTWMGGDIVEVRGIVNEDYTQVQWTYSMGPGVTYMDGRQVYHEETYRKR